MATTPRTAAPPREAIAVSGPQRILLVDDNVDFVTSLALLLESLGHEVGVAHEVQFRFVHVGTQPAIDAVRTRIVCGGSENPVAIKFAQKMFKVVAT